MAAFAAKYVDPETGEPFDLLAGEAPEGEEVWLYSLRIQVGHALARGRVRRDADALGGRPRAVDLAWLRGRRRARVIARSSWGSRCESGAVPQL